jgi:hypothetical protein
MDETSHPPPLDESMRLKNHRRIRRYAVTSSMTLGEERLALPVHVVDVEGLVCDASLFHLITILQDLTRHSARGAGRVYDLS